MPLRQGRSELELRRDVKKRDFAGSCNWCRLVDDVPYSLSVPAGSCSRATNIFSSSTVPRPVVADPSDRPQNFYNNILSSAFVWAGPGDRPVFICPVDVIISEDVPGQAVTSASDDDEQGDIRSHPSATASSTTQEFAEEGKLGFRFTPSDELESVDIGKGDRPRPMSINKELEPELKAKLVRQLQEFSDYFAWEYHEMLGLDRSIVEHQLPIKPGYRPYAQHPRKIDATIMDQVKAKIVEAAFIKPCRYAMWISSIMPVWKKNGKLRICIDFRDLNRATPKDEYPMPVTEVLVDAAAGHKMMSFLDGNAGYIQIFMAEDDVYKTTF